MNEMMGLEGLLGCLEGTYFWGCTWLEWSWGVRTLKTVSSKRSSARNSSKKGNALRGESGGGRMLVVLGNGWHCQWKQSLRSTAVANSSHTESSNAWLNIRKGAWALSLRLLVLADIRQVELIWTRETQKAECICRGGKLSFVWCRP